MLGGCVICTSAFAELATANIMYFRKSQAENVIKISKQIQNENIQVDHLDIANKIMNGEFNT